MDNQEIKRKVVKESHLLGGGHDFLIFREKETNSCLSNKVPFDGNV